MCYGSAFNKLRQVVLIGVMQKYKLTSLFNIYFGEYILTSRSDHNLVIDKFIIFMIVSSYS